MFGRKTVQKLMLLVLLIGLLYAAKVFAVQPDVRLLVDVSGSMKRTDPNNLRIPATNLLIDLLPAESKVGIWTFGTYTNSLVPHGKVDEAWRNNARNQAKKINSTALFTDIENAIERSGLNLNGGDASAQKHIILLSDGLVDISEAGSQSAREAGNQKSRDHLLRTLIPKLAKEGYIIHTLSLSDEADHDLMATMAQRTGGLHAIAYEAKDLMPLLLQIINRLAPSEEVPLQDNRFLIDPTIDEFTLLAFHAPGAQVVLHDPNNKKNTRLSNDENLRWHGNDRYTLVTVKSPLAGKWYLESPEHPDNRVTVISDIRLHSTSLPPTIYRGYPQEVEAWFTEEKKLINRREFLSLLSARAVHQKGAELLGAYTMPLAANQPHYQVTLDDFPKLGEQTLKIEVDGRTFLRQVTHSFNVQNVVAASLQLPDDGSHPRVILRAQHPDLKPADVNYLISANNKPLTAEYRGDGEWRVDLSALDRSVDQVIDVLVQTKIGNTPLKIDLPNLTLMAEQTEGTGQGLALPTLVPNPVPQVIPAPVLPMGMPESDVDVQPLVDAPPQEVLSEEVLPEELEEEGAKPGLFDPIESWDDPRMPWIYASVALANIALFLVAFFMYRNFVNKRKTMQESSNDESPLPYLDDSLGGELSDFEMDNDLESGLEDDDLDGLDDLDDLEDEFEDDEPENNKR